MSELGVKLNGEQLTISKKDDEHDESAVKAKVTSTKSDITQEESKPAGLVSLKRKGMEGDVPEQEFRERGTTVGTQQTLPAQNASNLPSRSSACNARRQ